MRACLAGESDEVELILPATNRLGKAIDCRVMCMPLLGSREVNGVIVVMEQLASGDHGLRMSK